MTYTITKRFEFSAAHQLAGLRDGHPCGRPHGHNYIVEVELAAEQLDEHGFVRDYGELMPVKVYLDRWFDHRNLNDVVEGNPTAERLAVLLFGVFQSQLPELSAVRVSETPKTWAEYRPTAAPSGSLTLTTGTASYGSGIGLAGIPALHQGAAGAPYPTPEGTNR